MGSTLGIAVLGTIVTTQTVNHAVRHIGRLPFAPATARAAIARVHALGANYAPVSGTPGPVASTLSGVVARAVATASRDAVLFAAAVVVIGAGLSLLIPKVGYEHPEALEVVEAEAIAGVAATL